MSEDLRSFARRFTISNLPTQRKGAEISGVYAILNTFSDNFYIGSSDHIARRFCAHLSQLRRGVHHAMLLQRAWRARGEAAFEFIILEDGLAIDALIVREAAWIALLRPKYNIGECAENGMRGRRHTPESIAKMRQNRKGKGLGHGRADDGGAKRGTSSFRSEAAPLASRPQDVRSATRAALETRYGPEGPWTSRRDQWSRLRIRETGC
jgi:group I intron endonuclease